MRSNKNYRPYSYRKSKKRRISKVKRNKNRFSKRRKLRGGSRRSRSLTNTLRQIQREEAERNQALRQQRHREYLARAERRQRKRENSNASSQSTPSNDSKLTGGGGGPNNPFSRPRRSNRNLPATQLQLLAKERLAERQTQKNNRAAAIKLQSLARRQSAKTRVQNARKRRLFAEREQAAIANKIEEEKRKHANTDKQLAKHISNLREGISDLSIPSSSINRMTCVKPTNDNSGLYRVLTNDEIRNHLQV